MPYDPTIPAPIFDAHSALAADTVRLHGRPMTSRELHQATDIPMGTLGNRFFYERLEAQHGITRRRAGRSAIFHPPTDA